MAIDIDIDVELLKSEIRKTYASVSDEPERDFIFPTGRAWAEDLGYPQELANVPDTPWSPSQASPTRGRSVGSRPVSACSISVRAPAPTHWSPLRWLVRKGGSEAWT
jgi:hypothetical protein